MVSPIEPVGKKRFQYKTMTESIAPNWMAIVNNFVKGSWAMPIIEEPMIIWPVDEMGKNSVMPSMMAKIMA